MKVRVSKKPGLKKSARIAIIASVAVVAALGIGFALFKAGVLFNDADRGADEHLEEDSGEASPTIGGEAAYDPRDEADPSRVDADADDASSGENDMRAQALGLIYLGMPRSEVLEVLGKGDFEGSGLDEWGYDDLCNIYFDGAFYEESEDYDYDGAIVTRVTTADKDWDIPTLVRGAVFERHADSISDGEYPVESHINLGIDADTDGFTIYIISLYETYERDGDYGVISISRSNMPLSLSFGRNGDGDYELTEYWQPEDDDLSASSASYKFPEEIQDRIDTQISIDSVDELSDNCYTEAMYHFVGAVPYTCRYGIGAGTASVTNNVGSTEEDDYFLVEYFPGAMLQIEKYDSSYSSSGPGNWNIVYADPGKNIAVGKKGSSSILITDDLIGIYDVDNGRYVMKFKLYVRSSR